MKQNILTAECFESTYALLVRSEEKERNIFESVVFLIIILSALFSIWHMVQQPLLLSRNGVPPATSVAQSTDTCPRA